MESFIKNTTLKDILVYLKDGFVDIFYFWANGAEKIATLDWLNLNIPEILVSIFLIYLSYDLAVDAGKKWKEFNAEVYNVAEALNSEVETDNMVKYFKRIDYGKEYKGMSDEKILETIQQKYKKKKGKINLYAEQAFAFTWWYWGACLVYFFTYIY